MAANRAWLLGQVTPNSRVADPEPERRRLIVSYELSPVDSPYGYHRSYLYDNAVAAMAFITLGELDRAAFTLHAIARLVRPDGSLWFSYSTANSWPSEADHDSALVRAGAVAWAGYALTYYLEQAPACLPGDAPCDRERNYFLRTAEKLAAYLATLQVSEPGDPRYGLLRLGYGSIELQYHRDAGKVLEVYSDSPAKGISSENNISAWFFLRSLGRVTGKSHWKNAADLIREGLLNHCWNPGLKRFSQGFKSDGELDTEKALDCASWGALLLLAVGEVEKAMQALESVEEYHSVQDAAAVGFRPYFDSRVYPDEGVGGYFYPDSPRKEWRELPVVWSEGTLGVALAYLRAGRAERAQQVVEGLRALQGASGGLRYASRDVPHHMADVPAVAASAWLLLVTESLAGNPSAEGFMR